MQGVGGVIAVAARQADGRASERAAAADVEEDWGAARAWGEVLWVGVDVAVGGRSVYRVGVDGGTCVCVRAYVRDAWRCIAAAVVVRGCGCGVAGSGIWRRRRWRAGWLAGWLLAVRLSRSLSLRLSPAQGVHSAKQNSPLG